MGYRTVKRVSNILYFIFLVSVVYSLYKWYPLTYLKMCPTKDLLFLRNLSIGLGILAVVFDFAIGFLNKYNYQVRQVSSSTMSHEFMKKKVIEVNQGDIFQVLSNDKFVVNGKSYKSSIEIKGKHSTRVEIRNLKGEIRKL